MNTRTAIDFLNQLKENNNREWFQENKSRYYEIKEELLSVLDRLIPEIATFFPDVAAIAPKDCIFRIYRDVRFSNNKLPYKTQIGAFISKTGRKGSQPGFYIHIEPGQSFLAGGLYMPPPEMLKAVRNEIYFNASQFTEIIGHPEFLKYFGSLDDFDKLTRPPKGFSADWPDIELLKYRSYVVTHPVNDDALHSANFLLHTKEVFKAMGPLNDFLKNAISNM
jgi:uncharacterized protein (TIGR02453 family)